jgi:hypothetical protein
MHINVSKNVQNKHIQQKQQSRASGTKCLGSNPDFALISYANPISKCLGFVDCKMGVEIILMFKMDVINKFTIWKVIVFLIVTCTHCLQNFI